MLCDGLAECCQPQTMELFNCAQGQCCLNLNMKYEYDNWSIANQWLV